MTEAFLQNIYIIGDKIRHQSILTSWTAKIKSYLLFLSSFLGFLNELLFQEKALFSDLSHLLQNVPLLTS